MNKKIFQKSARTKGAALLIFVVLFLATSLSLVLSIGRGVYDDLAMYKVLESGKESFYGAESGIEDAILRLRENNNYSDTESFSFDNVAVVVTRTSSSGVYEIIAEGNSAEAIRRSRVELAIGSGVSFGFGLQSGNGGLSLANTSKVYGNVFSNGAVTGSGNFIYGDVISAGPSGLIDSVHATGSAWAHSIAGSTIDDDAYYQSIVGTMVSGANCTSNINCHPGSTDQATRTMPIADSIIEEWKTVAEGGGTLPLASCSGGLATGTYTIDTNQTIGPIKIPCNLEISQNATVLTVSGPIWVEGNLTTKNGPTIAVDASLANKSVSIIVDNESNRATSSKIIIQGSTGYMGASGDSYVLMVSMNNSSENGGTEIAADVDNNTPGSEREVIYYAPYGQLLGRNSLLLRGATAHQISLSNSAGVYYEEGMADPLFTGSGGGYVISSWKEVI